MDAFKKLFLLVTIVFSTSCGEDISLVGDWNLTFYDIESCISINDNLYVDVRDDPCTIILTKRVCYETDLVFREDGTATVTITTEQSGFSRTDTFDFTYDHDNENITMCSNPNDCWQGTFSLVEGILNIVAVGIDDGCSILIEAEQP